KRLSTAEAAMLVALPQSPEVRRPDRAPKAARAARDRVLARLVAEGAVSEDQAIAARLEDTPQGRRAFPVLAAHVSARLARADPDNAVEKTTISRYLQEQLESLAHARAVAIGGGVSVAIIAVDNASGEVIAHVGGIDYF